MSWIFLAPFLHNRRLLPFGWDTIGYIWRINVVHDLGIGSLTHAATMQAKTLGDRPIYMVVGAALETLTGKPALVLAWVLPAVVAVTIALAAGAFAVDAMKLPRWWAIPVGVGTGASSFVALTGSYATNLTADALLLAAAALTVRVASRSEGASIGIALLMGATFVTHWMFALVGLGVLWAYAVVLRIVHRGRATRTASRQITRALDAGVAIGALAFLLAPQLPGTLPQIRTTNVAIIAARRLPGLPLTLLFVIAAASVLLLLSLRRRELDFGALLLQLWVAVFPLGLFAWYVLKAPVPPYRTAGFLVALPVLVILAGAAIQGRSGPSGRRWHVVGGLVGVLVAAWLALDGAGLWWERQESPALDQSIATELAAVASYVSLLPEHTPLLFTTTRQTDRAVIRYVLASGLPASRLLDIHMVRVEGNEAFPSDPSIPTFYLAGYNSGEPPTDANRLDRGAFLLSGPVPARETPPGESPMAPPPFALIGLAIACVAILTVVGLGWSFAVIETSLSGRLALAPALGVATLGLSGLVLSRLGLPFAGGAWVMLVLATCSGWLALAIRRSGRNHLRGRTSGRHLSGGVDALS